MSLSVETLAVARKYTDDSLAGAGAVAGVPCKIQSITAITGGNRVTFLWTDNNGDDHTSAMDVMNGVDGEDGKGIQSVSVNAQNHLIITYTDGTTVDAGQIEIHSSVDSVNGQTGAVVLDAEDVGALPDNTPIPSKTSDLTNDSGFATTSDVSTALADYTTTADLTTLLAAKQDTLTFDNVPTENSNNPVKSGGVYAVNEALTNQANDMVNVLGAKNFVALNRSPYKSQVLTNASVTNQTEDSVTLTSNAHDYANLHLYYTLPAGQYIVSYDFESDDTSYQPIISIYDAVGGNFIPGGRNILKNEQRIITVEETHKNLDIRLFITTANDAVVRTGTYKNFMIRLASDPDDTYVPYAKTNQQLTQDSVTWNDLSEVGAVNYCKNNATTTTTTDGTTTFTWTVNDDKSVSVSAPSYPVTVASHQTLVIWENISADECKPLVGKTFKLTGCPSGGGLNNFKITVYRAETADGSTGTPEDFGNGKVFTWLNDASGTKANISLSVRSGYTMTGPLTFKPMLTDPSYNGPYVPYAKTNKELTELVGEYPLKWKLYTSSIQLFDILANGETNTIHFAYASLVYVGEQTLAALLSMGNYSSVEVYKYAKYVQNIKIIGQGNCAFGYTSPIDTTIKLCVIKSTGTTEVILTKP